MRLVVFFREEVGGKKNGVLRNFMKKYWEKDIYIHKKETNKTELGYAFI